MCGKSTQLATWEEVVEFSQPMTVPADKSGIVVAMPMRFASIMRLNAAGQREMVSMRWGFACQGDATPGQPKHMHARCETIDTKPTFAEAFARGLRT